MRRPGNRTSRALLRSVVTAATLLAPGCGPDHPPATVGRDGTPDDPATALVTDGEKAGEEIFRRENCDRCHTLFDRPPAGGRIELPPGPSVEILGSRVGPDLGLEGHRHGDEWHYAHLYAPGAVVPGSRMPPSRHLFRPVGGRPVPTCEAVDLVAYLQALGRARRDVWAERRRREPAIPAPPPLDTALTRRGEELYRRHCAACHGAGGDGKGEVAGFFSFPPRDFVTGRYRFKSTPMGRWPTDADLFRTITMGTGTGAAMPAFDWLGDADLWALVRVVKEFSPALRGSGLSAEARPSGQAADRRSGEHIAEGRRLWMSLGCPSCHGASGAGMTREEADADRADGAGVVVPRSGDLTHACFLRGGASEQAIERALLYGVGETMPSYADALTEGEGRALVSFILSLEDDLTSPRIPDRP
jgi:cytochrome c oxidase cbb3-type subunit 2